MTEFDLFLLAGTATVALLLALGVLAGVAGVRRREVSRRVDDLTEQATTGDIDALITAIRTDDEGQTR
ncbi:hypothetical protein [Streptomonospora wellingtoniae]|uniref:Uncharacterized protein n=1 Tax=Streptomonospora wellingtoniae TaxID=3075544 RepID=A0ABU2L0L6_9ACTN|nr:hypothetical protein [Streptomonospora sp. DSM 45055]MDT0305094.1 hypothetical protein [Streptomonospora sp. DSM 45055]